MSMTERREPRERPDRLANRNHSPCHTSPTMAINPYRLTTAPPYGRRSARSRSRPNRIRGLALCRVDSALIGTLRDQRNGRVLSRPPRGCFGDEGMIPHGSAGPSPLAPSFPCCPLHRRSSRSRTRGANAAHRSMGTSRRPARSLRSGQCRRSTARFDPPWWKPDGWSSDSVARMRYGRIRTGRTELSWPARTARPSRSAPSLASVAQAEWRTFVE